MRSLFLLVCSGEFRNGAKREAAAARVAAATIARLINVFTVSLLFIHFIVASSSASRSWDSFIPASMPEL